MKFNEWLKLKENGLANISNQTSHNPSPGESPAPASSEVIRTGKQPQVGSETSSKGLKLDTILAVDGQIANLKNTMSDILKGELEGNDLLQSFKTFLSSWENTKNSQNNITNSGGLGDIDFTPEELENKKRSQPPVSFMPGPMPGITDSR